MPHKPHTLAFLFMAMMALAAPCVALPVQERDLPGVLRSSDRLLESSSANWVPNGALLGNGTLNGFIAGEPGTALLQTTSLSSTASCYPCYYTDDINAFRVAKINAAARCGWSFVWNDGVGQANGRGSLISDQAGGAFLVKAHDGRCICASPQYDGFITHISSAGNVSPDSFAVEWGPLPGCEPTFISDHLGVLYTGAPSGCTEGSVSWAGLSVTSSDLGAASFISGFVPDEQRGALVGLSTTNAGSGSSLLSVQRVHVDSTVYGGPAILPMWEVGGVRVSSVVSNQLEPWYVADGAGGVTVAWWDFRVCANYGSLYVQHIAAAGYRAWNESGVQVSSSCAISSGPFLVQCANGDVLVAWAQGGNDVRVQRFGAFGQPLWAADGVSVSSGTGSRSLGSMIALPGSECLLVWSDSRSGDSDIYAQRLGVDGVAKWTPGGIAICTASGAQTGPVAVQGGTEDILIAWNDMRSGSSAVYGMAVGLDGMLRVGPPPPPSALTCTSQECGLKIRLDWSSDALGNIGFQIQSKIDGASGDFATLATVPSGTLTYTDTRADGMPYVYRVRGVNGSTYSGFSPETRAGFATYVGNPPAPSSIKAKSVGDGTTIRVTIGPPGWNTSWKNLAAVLLESSLDPGFDVSSQVSIPAVSAASGSSTDYSFTAIPGSVVYFRARFQDQCGRVSVEPTDTISAPARRAPVVFVHGICGNAEGWNNGSWNWPQVMADVGIRSVVLDLLPNDASWMDWRWPLRRKIAEKLAGEWSRDEKVDIVAYSQGGLAARGVIEQCDGDSMVRNLVMLCTPNHGGQFTTIGQSASIFGPLAWVCQTQFPDGAPGLRSLVGGCRSLVALDYPGCESMPSERIAGCGPHVPEFIGMGSGATGPKGVQYWTFAGTGGSVFSILDELAQRTTCLSDGVVPAHSVELASLANSHQYLDTELPGAWPIAHSGWCGMLSAKPVLQSPVVAAFARDILLGSPPAKVPFMAAAGQQSPRLSEMAPSPKLLGEFLDVVPVTGVATRAVVIDPCDSFSVMIAWPDTALELALQDPDGVIHTAAESGPGSAIFFERSNAMGYAAFRVRSPRTGQWVARVSGNATGVVENVVTTWGLEGTLYNAQVALDRDSVGAGDRVRAFVQLHAGTALQSAVVSGIAVDPSGGSHPLTFRDDGTGGDALAGDLVYSAEWTADAMDGLWTSHVDAASLPTPDGVVHRSATAQFVVSHAPSLSIVRSSLFASSASPTMGDSVQVSAKVANSGPAGDAAVQVSIADLSTGELVDARQIAIASGETTLVVAQWRPRMAGVHMLQASAYSATGSWISSPETLGVAVRIGGVLGVGPGSEHRLITYLRSPFPNPTLGATAIHFSISTPGRVRIVVYDIAGRRVRQLIDAPMRAGEAQVTWDGDDEVGHRMGKGVFFVQMNGPGIRAARRVVILR